MTEWPEELCRNCGQPKEPERVKEVLCEKCADFLEPTERIEIRVSKRFVREMTEGMELGAYGPNRAEFIREAIRHFIRYLKGEQEQKNVIEGVVERLSQKRAQNLRLIEEAIEELKEMP